MPEPDAAELAYAAAEARIAESKATGTFLLFLDGRDCRALTRIPPQIAELTELKVVLLNGTQISDLSPLADLIGITQLRLDGTRVTDLTPLAGLIGLKELSLNGTGVTDLTPLAGLGGLTELSFNGTGVTDLTLLTGLTRLRALQISKTGVADLTPISAFKGLQELWLDQTGVTDLSPLDGLTKLKRLKLDQTQVSDLTPLAGLTELTDLRIDQTSVTDLTPLAGLIGLTRFRIDRTSVSDLTPLEHLKELQELLLHGTQVADLRPIRELTQFGTNSSSGLSFTDTPATQRDAELARLAKIDDAAQRTRDTLAYLNTLPPWPEPLPWQIPDAVPDDAPDAPQPDMIPRIVLTDDNRIDVQPTPPDSTSLRDPIRARLYGRLPELLDRLVPHGNRYPEINGPLHALRDLVAVPFDQADILLIHLEIAALTDLRESQSDRPKTERLDADCDIALAGVLRVAPGITIGHPDVDILEQRTQDYARQRLPETVAEGERRIALGLVTDHIATDRTQEYAIRSASALPGGRSAEIRRGFVRNIVIAMVAVADAGTALVATEAVVMAASFLIAHKDAIIATSPAWGQTGYAWASYVLIRAQQVVDDATRK